MSDISIVGVVFMGFLILLAIFVHMGAKESKNRESANPIEEAVLKRTHIRVNKENRTIQICQESEKYGVWATLVCCSSELSDEIEKQFKIRVAEYGVSIKDEKITMMFNTKKEET